MMITHLDACAVDGHCHVELANETVSHYENEEEDHHDDEADHVHHHRHSPDEPEHSHTHQHSHTHAFGSQIFFGSEFHFVSFHHEKLIFSTQEGLQLRGPFLDSVFRPPIS